jgi:hypothetical protein
MVLTQINMEIQVQTGQNGENGPICSGLCVSLEGTVAAQNPKGNSGMEQHSTRSTRHFSYSAHFVSLILCPYLFPPPLLLSFSAFQFVVVVVLLVLSLLRPWFPASCKTEETLFSCALQRRQQEKEAKHHECLGGQGSGTHGCCLRKKRKNKNLRKGGTKNGTQ